jgi:integrase
MRVFKRGEKYYYEFRLHRRLFKKSTRCKNKADALNIATAERMRLLNAKAGIQLPRTSVPTLNEFSVTFMDWVRNEIESTRTREYYDGNMLRLIEYRSMASTPIDQIDEPMIESFKRWVSIRVSKVSGRPISKSTINRYLGTLKKALRYAHRKLKLIDRVPVIELYKAGRNREYVFSNDEFNKWLRLCNEPLRSASILARYSGICRGEMVALLKDSVTLFDEPDCDGSYGEIEVRRGLKRDCRRRTLKVNQQMKEVLDKLISRSTCEHVFTAVTDPSRPLHAPVLSVQLRRVKKQGNFHADACLHTLRHTFLTEMGEITDAFTLQKIAGHTRIETTMRYVHPQKKAINSAFQKFFAASTQ